VRILCATSGFDAKFDPPDLSHLQIRRKQAIIIAEMSGIFFDLPSVRFLRRFRFLKLMLQTFARSLLRWLRAPASASRQGHFRYNKAEFPLAPQSACRKFDWALDDSRAADGVPSLFGALRPFNHWKKLKDQHELLFIRKTPTPFARWGPTQNKLPTLSRTADSSENAEEDILATSCRVFRKRQGQTETGGTGAQWRAAFATGAQTGAG